MITIRNQQRKIVVDQARMRRDATAILEKLKYADFDLGIVLVNDARMQQFNRDYRGHDKPTDILSFPFHTLVAGERIMPQSPDDKNLGDLVINLPYVVRAAAELEMSLEEHLRMLLVHGIFHLLGYDHITDEDYAVMQEQEAKMLKHLKGL